MNTPVNKPAHAPMDQFASQDGDLVIGGYPLSRLAERVGQTPFYAYSRDLLRARVAHLRQALPAAVKLGGPDGDTGLTGRKIIVDTYGGAAPHGGGAFSGKDPTKVDRSAAYVARYLAKNIVAAGVSEKCLIQLSYAIGVSQPLSIYIDLFDGEDKKSKKIEEIISKNFNLSPRGIRELLKLNKPIYQKTAAYGHFGRQPEDNGSFSWEKTDLIKYFQSKV